MFSYNKFFFLKKVSNALIQTKYFSNILNNKFKIMYISSVWPEKNSSAAGKI